MAATAKHSALRILVVEDGAVEAPGLAAFLADCGHRVVTRVGSPDAAVNAAMVHHPDLVIMDVGLQATDASVEAARTIRQRWGIPTVFIAADRQVRDQVRKARPLGLLVKPVMPEHLRETLQTASALRRAQRGQS